MPLGHRASLLLKTFLADGPRTTTEIWQAGLENDLYERTLRRAKKDLQIRNRTVTVEGKRRCYWLLPGQTLPAEAGAVSEVEAYLDALNEQFPGPSPLDEQERDSRG